MTISFFDNIFRYQFLQYALAASFLSSIASGIVGSIVVVRRSTYIAGAISHCVLGGIGVARFFQVYYKLEWLDPIFGAIIAALAAAIIIAWSISNVRERVDSILSVIWAVGMSIGITFIIKTPGYGQDVMSYLFGSIIMVSFNDIVLMIFLNSIIGGIALLFYNRILAISFNEEAAKVRGVSVTVFTFIFTIITALTIVLLVRIVGVIMVIALLSIPPAIASKFTKRLSTMMLFSCIASFLFTSTGLVLSYEFELPAGATMIQVAGICYFLSMAKKKKHA